MAPGGRGFSGRMKMKGSAGLPFKLRERASQIAYFDESHPGRQYYRGAAHRLIADERTLNLAPGIRDAAIAYFGDQIAWHTHANHALSSQVCCLNFLMPLATDRDRLSILIG